MTEHSLNRETLNGTRDLSILTAKAMIIVLAVVAVTLAFRPKHSILSRPLTEDGYYSLTVTRHLASGEGMTNSAGQETNGFQPLFTFLTVPAFWIASGNRFEAIRFVLIMQWLVWLASAWLVGLIARDGVGSLVPGQSRRLFWWTLLLFLGSSWIFMASFNGLETGFEIFMYAVLWRYFQLGKHETKGGLILFGVLLGLLVLTRIDSVFFVIIVSVFFLLKDRERPIVERAVKFVITGGVAFLVSLPWWANNVLHFGSLMPISGKAEQTWMFSFYRLGKAGEALLRVAVPYLYLGQTHFEGPAADVARLFILIAIVWLVSKTGLHLGRSLNKAVADGAPDRTTERTVEFAGLILAAMLALLVWYMLSSFATWFYVRYTTPLSIVSTVALSLAAVKAFGSPRRFHLLIPILAVVPVCLVNYELSAVDVSNQYFDQQVYLVEKYVPEDALVGAKQSGTLGYCRDNVVNLDGKVNAQVDRRGFVMSKYLRDSNINWLCDWNWMVVPDLTGKDPQSNGWELVAKAKKFVLYHRVESLSNQHGGMDEKAGH